MTRILSLFLFACIMSVCHCRHLDNVVSDARTFRNQGVVGSPSAVGNPSSVGNVQGLEETPRTTNTAAQTAPGNIIKQPVNPPEISPPVQTMPRASSEDVPSPSDIVYKPSLASSSASPLSSKDTSDIKPAVGIIEPNHVEGTVEENTHNALTQSTWHASDTTGIIDTSKQPTNIGLHGSTSPELPTANAAVINADSVPTSGDNISPEVNNEVIDYEKNHAQLETASSSVRMTDAALGGDMKDTGNGGTNLPYVKLDNVNDANVDNTPVIRPEMNHIDRTVDVVNEIEMPPTEDPTSYSTSTAASVPIVSETITTPSITDDIQTDIITEDKVVVPTPDNIDQDRRIKTISNVPSPDKIERSENPMNTGVNAGMNTPVAHVPVELNTPTTHSVAPITTSTATATTVEATKDPAPTVDNVGTTGDVNATVSAVANPTVNAGLDVSATATPITDNMGNRDPEDVDPLDIFVDDITYQRFPRAMPLSLFKEKISGQTFKKLYILESSEKKLFQNVRQLEVTYQLEGEELYAEFLFRFIYSRQCTRIEKFKLGTLAKDSKTALFEKGVEEAKTERLVFFSQRPDDYMFLMSCTDDKNSPYACRETYYVTLDSKHDPPNQFPWLDAARELENEMNLSFEDPRFIFNFVMMPCARG